MSNKLKIITLLLCIFIGKGFLLAQHLMHYSSDRFAYSMMLPEDWKRNDVLKSANISLVLISPDEAVVSVSFYMMIGHEKEVFMDGYTKSLTTDSNNLQLQEKGMFKARDNDADYLVYTYLKDDVLMREKVCFFQRENEMAVVSAMHSDEHFNGNLAVFNEILVSFTFETNQDKVEKVD